MDIISSCLIYSSSVALSSPPYPDCSENCFVVPSGFELAIKSSFFPSPRLLILYWCTAIPS